MSWPMHRVTKFPAEMKRINKAKASDISDIMVLIMDLKALKIVNPLAVSIAIRHIISRRRQTLLSVLAVALAVSISVIFTSLVNGQQQILTGLVEEKLLHVSLSHGFCSGAQLNLRTISGLFGCLARSSGGDRK